MATEEVDPGAAEQHLRSGMLFMFDDGIGGCADGAERLLSTSARALLWFTVRFAGRPPSGRRKLMLRARPSVAQLWRTMTLPASCCTTTRRVRSAARRPPPEHLAGSHTAALPVEKRDATS